eukprot:jgi/Botrbrau1/19792/Bobra.0124s0040.1
MPTNSTFSMRTPGGFHCLQSRTGADACGHIKHMRDCTSIAYMAPNAPHMCGDQPAKTHSFAKEKDKKNNIPFWHSDLPIFSEPWDLVPTDTACCSTGDRCSGPVPSRLVAQLTWLQITTPSHTCTERGP